MAGGSNSKAGEAYYLLSLKDGPLTKGLRATAGKLRAFGASIKGIGLKIAGFGSALKAPFAAAEGLFTSMGSELAEMSAKTGVSVESLSQLGYAAKQSGVDMEGLENGLKKMQRRIGDAEQGNVAAIDSFAKLRISIAQLRGLSPDKQFELIADRISHISDPAQRAAISMEIFGRAGVGLLPLMQDGAAGIEEMRKQAEGLGLTMSGESADSALTLRNALSTLADVVKAVGYNVGAALAPALTAVVGRITGFASAAIGWIKANTDIIVGAAKVGTILVAVGAAIYAAGTAFTVAASIVGGFATAIGVVGTVFGVVAGAIGFLLTPVGLVAAAVVGLGVYFAKTTDIIKNSIQWLGGIFSTLKDDALKAFGGIKDALSAGDFGLAARILWATINLEFHRGIEWLEEKWLGFTTFFKDALTKASYALSAVLVTAWEGLRSAWAETCSFLTDCWTTFTSLVGKGWNDVAGATEKAWRNAKSQVTGDDKNLSRDNAATDARTNEANANIDKEWKRKFDASKAKLKSQQDAIDAEKKGVMRQLQSAEDAELAKHQAAADEKRAKLEQDLEMLKGERDALLHQAGKEAWMTSDKYLTNGGGMDALKKKLAAGQDATLAEMHESVAGTFNARTAGRELGGNPQKHLATIAQNGAQANRLLAKIAQQVGIEGVLEFGF